jgi:hypothetical protein
MRERKKREAKRVRKIFLGIMRDPLSKVLFSSVHKNINALVNNNLIEHR